MADRHLNGDTEFELDKTSGILVPTERQQEDIEKRLIREGPKCPAAEVGRYGDTGRVYVKCGIARNQFAVRHSPMAAHKWCGGDYAGATDPFGPCPVWQAMKDGDPALERSYEAQKRAHQEEVTKRQIERGFRVDDRGHDPSLPTGTRETLEELEESGE